MTTSNARDSNALFERLEFYAAMGRAGNFSAAALLVAFNLLYRHLNGRTGRCDPARATLAGETGLDERSIRRAIRELEESGWWIVGRNEGTAGRGGRTNTYRPNLERGVNPVPPSEEGTNRPPFETKEGTHLSPLRAERGDSNGRKGGLTCPPNQEEPETHKEGVCEDSSLEEFWRTYPSRAPHPDPRKPAAEKFTEALKRGVDPAEIIRGARNYARYVDEYVADPQRIAFAATWLDQERWNDHQQPPERPPMRVGLV
jgi:Helix-turn-helix domain